MIAYDFPPAGGGGVQRTTKFVRYLPEFRWAPHVLTVENPLYLLQDESLLADVAPGLEVSRAREWLPNRSLLRLRRRLRGDSAAGVPQAPHASSGGAVTARRRGWRMVLRGGLLAFARLAWPDIHLAWAVPAAVRATMIARRARPDVIWATAPPFSVLLAAWLAHRWTGVPFVVDLRDAWSLNPLRLGTAKAAREWPLERRILREAACVVCATEPMADQYRTALPERADRVTVVLNGYDERDFDGVAPRRLEGLSVVYTGRVTPKLRLDAFGTALRTVLDRRQDLETRLRLYFVGDVYPTQLRTLEEAGLRHLTRLVGYLPHREALAYVLGADVLLLLGSGDLAEMTGKVFEYLRSRRPILAVVPPDSAAGRLLTTTGGGVIAPLHDTNRAAAAVEQVLDQIGVAAVHQGQTLPAAIARLERRKQTQELAAVLERAAAEGLDA